MFGATTIVKTDDKGKHVYSSYGIVLMEKIHGVLTMTMLKML